MTKSERIHTGVRLCGLSGLSCPRSAPQNELPTPKHFSFEHSKAGMPVLGLTEAAMGKRCCRPVHSQGTYRCAYWRRDVLGTDEAGMMQDRHVWDLRAL